MWKLPLCLDGELSKVYLCIKNDAFLCKLCSTLSGGIPSDIQSCRGFWVNKTVHITDHFRRSVLNHQNSKLNKANEKLLKELKRYKLTKKGGVSSQILAGHQNRVLPLA